MGDTSHTINDDTDCAAELKKLLDDTKDGKLDKNRAAAIKAYWKARATVSLVMPH